MDSGLFGLSYQDGAAWFWGAVGLFFLLNRIGRFVRRMRRGHRPKAAPSRRGGSEQVE